MGINRCCFYSRTQFCSSSQPRDPRAAHTLTTSQSMNAWKVRPHFCLFVLFLCLFDGKIAVFMDDYKTMHCLITTQSVFLSVALGYSHFTLTLFGLSFQAPFPLHGVSPGTRTPLRCCLHFDCGDEGNI